MLTLAAVGFIWGACWLAVPVVGGLSSGARATVLLAVVAGVLGIGECLHGTVQAPLVTDLADDRLYRGVDDAEQDGVDDPRRDAQAEPGVLGRCAPPARAGRRG